MILDYIITGLILDILVNMTVEIASNGKYVYHVNIFLIISIMLYILNNNFQPVYIYRLYIIEWKMVVSSYPCVTIIICYTPKSKLKKLQNW